MQPGRRFSSMSRRACAEFGPVTRLGGKGPPYVVPIDSLPQNADEAQLGDGDTHPGPDAGRGAEQGPLAR